MKAIKAIINSLSFLKSTSQLEYFVRSKDPKTHAEVEKLVRDYFSIRGL